MDSAIKFRKNSGILLKKTNKIKEKQLSINFSPKEKLNFNFSPNHIKPFKNVLLSLDKKKSNYISYINKNSNIKPNNRVNMLKENNLLFNQSLENVINNKSLSITSFIRDENNSLHNSVERVPLTNPNSSTSKNKKVTDSVKNKILVLDYKENASRNNKNPNINVLSPNPSSNPNKIVNSQNIRKRFIKENSRNILNKICNKDDTCIPNPSSIGSRKLKNPFSKFVSNSKFLMFKTKLNYDNSTNKKITSTNILLTDNNVNTEKKLLNNTESLNDTLQTNHDQHLALSMDKKNTKNVNLENSNINTIETKEEKSKLQTKQIKRIPVNTTINSQKNPKTAKTKKNSNSLSSNNEIFLRSNLNFQKSNPNQERKNVSNNSLTKNKNINSIEYFTPKEIMDKFSKYLNSFEQEEIFLFREIYYCGKFLKNKQQMMKIESNSNLGSSLVRNNTSTNEEDKNININEIYKDDEQGNFTFKKGDQISYRYEILNELGRGSFGIALKCFDHKTKEQCCVKVVKNKKKVLDQAKIEIQILEFIKNKDTNNECHIVRIIHNFSFRNHICIVFELLDMNLYELVKNLDFQGIDIKQVRKIALQLLETLIFLKRNKIIHCDLKPENILIKNFSKAEINVIDFGSSCFENEKLYSYLQSRFYRAPEVILGAGYGIEIDMWSFGCIIAELYSGIPIFPGESSIDQINYIMEYIGVPPLEIINVARKKTMFFEDNGEPLKIPNSKGKIRMPLTKKLEKFLSESSDSFIDLVRNCLVWDPRKRIKPHEALLHPFISNETPLLKELNEKKNENKNIRQDEEKKHYNSKNGKVNLEKYIIPKKINLKLNLNDSIKNNEIINKNSKKKDKLTNVTINSTNG